MAPTPTTLRDLVMEAPPAYSPRAAGTTLPAHKLTDVRFGLESHSTGTYSARCDTCPAGSPLLEWAATRPALGYFLWNPDPEAPADDSTSLPPWDLMPALWAQR
eukprot:7228816-Pyramimonas_sp.AAC.1